MDPVVAVPLVVVCVALGFVLGVLVVRYLVLGS